MSAAKHAIKICTLARKANWLNGWKCGTMLMEVNNLIDKHDDAVFHIAYGLERD